MAQTRCILSVPAAELHRHYSPSIKRVAEISTISTHCYQHGQRIRIAIICALPREADAVTLLFDDFGATLAAFWAGRRVDNCLSFDAIRALRDGKSVANESSETKLQTYPRMYR
ncbi:hypothetical protein LMH87_003524 [Akanthomyces muscarius]|uniref:Uncharacterized protein n=1 Tax=Akanthomyces muscarius TaxID=2231603 RepID=A0A9W8Q236_AKAMU|nr:hypothetical protein LMH87_003524 [Akanthomyces muscarius]KAJ4144649.1 hypothetical protein LMH87_003524 [Akanthomyces muscarius]